MKNDKRLAALIVLVILMFLWLYVRPVWVRSNCYKKAYIPSPRTNEDNYEWAEGKMWLPEPDNDVTDHASYVWIYPDQSIHTRYGSEAKVKIEKIQLQRYNQCLLINGFKP